MVRGLGRHISLSLCVLFCASVFESSNARADDFTPGPTRIIVGFGASSTADTVARLVAKYISDHIGQPVIVENRPGNSSMTAAEFVARAPNDGRTLFMATVANTLYPASMKSPFNLGKDMVPIALLAEVPNVLVAHPSLQVRTVRDLVNLAKSKPETLSFGTSGVGTASHMATQMFNMEAGANVATVPYQGGANQGVLDLLAGRINLMFNVAATLAPYVKEGKLIALAVGQPRRAAAMPDVPTMDEAGMPGFDVGIWIGLLAPTGTPPNIIDNLSKLSTEGVRSPEGEKALNAQGIDVLGGTPAEFSKFIEKDNEKWARILAAVGPK
jgi:tripartite-type tricarboxylate transporter receptor subunit TctC